MKMKKNRERKMSYDAYFPPKFKIYLYYHRENEDKRDYDVEMIYEMEEIKNVREKLNEMEIKHDILPFYHYYPQHFHLFFEKLYFTEQIPYIVFYNCIYPIDNMLLFIHHIQEGIQEMKENDILLYEMEDEEREEREVKRWIEEGKIPRFAILKQDSFYKILHKKYEMIQIKNYFLSTSIFHKNIFQQLFDFLYDFLSFDDD
jgi:hypothetical protein